MTKAAISVTYFGYYLLVLGVIVIFAPNTLLDLFQMEPTNEVWIRVVGVLTLMIGLYYVRTAPTNNEVFLKTTVIARVLVMLWFTIFVLVGWVSFQLIFFGAVDLAGAAWTWLAMRKTMLSFLRPCPLQERFLFWCRLSSILLFPRRLHMLLYLSPRLRQFQHPQTGWS